MPIQLLADELITQETRNPAPFTLTRRKMPKKFLTLLLLILALGLFQGEYRKRLLSLADFDFVHEGTTFDEIIFKTGVPDLYFGFGRSFYAYHLQDGQDIVFDISGRWVKDRYTTDIPQLDESPWPVNPTTFLPETNQEINPTPIAVKSQAEYLVTAFRPVSYEDLCGASKEFLENASEQELLQWIAEKYHPINSGKSTNSSENVVIHKWVSDSYRGMLEFHHGQLDRITFLRVPTIKLGQILNGIGTPPHLDRDYGISDRIGYSFWLDYPAEGLYILTSTTKPLNTAKRPDRLWASLSRELEVHYVICYFTPGWSQQHADKRIPWPGIDVLVPFIDPP